MFPLDRLALPIPLDRRQHKLPIMLASCKAPSSYEQNPLLLFCDNHESPISVDGLDYAYSNCVFMLSFSLAQFWVRLWTLHDCENLMYQKIKYWEIICQISP